MGFSPQFNVCVAVKIGYKRTKGENLLIGLGSPADWE
jgi:hypothetical protein